MNFDSNYARNFHYYTNVIAFFHSTQVLLKKKNCADDDDEHEDAENCKINITFAVSFNLLP
jgi:hypothetical protein